MRAMVGCLLMLACGRTVVDELPPAGGGSGGSTATAGGSGGSGPTRCVPGRVEACACLGQAAMGVQTCNSAGIFGTCQCPATTCQPGETFACACPNGSAGTRACGSMVCTGCTPTSGLDASTPGPDGGAGRADGGVVLYAGTDTLVDLFPVSGGLIVVRSTTLQLLDVNGAEVTRVDSPREITSAAFDGTLLGVADRAMLTVYDTALTSLRSTNLIDVCASSVAVSGSRFVCGPDYDWDRIFSTFDMTTGMQLRRGPNKYTYNGVPMRRVPGTDDFVTVTTSLSPSDFHLYRVAADSSVAFMGESPYHGDFAASMVFAFDRTPATRLINQQGVILRIYDTNCMPSTNGQGCFIRDGNLGTLPNQKSFLAMTETGDGTIYGIVDRGSGSFFDAACKMGCDVQRIDFDARVVRGQVSWAAEVARIVAAKYDPYRQQLVVGYLRPGASHNTFNGFQIVGFRP
ncbi:MAG: hypothetical protein JNK82_35055 [Myxococcaceae bacterium]|nr:hypothetical protein [Myxococcaceae bacterium]